MPAPAIPTTALTTNLHAFSPFAPQITRDEKDPSGKVWRSERSAFSFARSFTLPENCKGDDICACMENGVLKVCIPKKETEVSEGHACVWVDVG